MGWYICLFEQARIHLYLCLCIIKGLIFLSENISNKSMACKKRGSTNVSNTLYSYDAFFQQQLQNFISFGEHETDTHTLFAVCATETNDGPKEEPLGVRLKLPPFKGWKDLGI